MATFYRASDGADQSNRNIFTGGLGGWAGRLLIQPSAGYTVIADADPNGPLMQAQVCAASFTADNQIAIVWGLTFCIGVIVAREAAPGRLGDVVVAHFNGGWDHDGSWANIASRMPPGPGALHAIVIATTDTTPDEMINRVGETFRANLTGAPLAIDDDNIILYRSNRSGVEIGVTRRGLLGEPEPKLAGN